MSKTIFLSTVSQEFRDVRRRLASFGQRTHKLDIRHQDEFANRGVVTLRMLEEEVCQSDYVVHLIGQQAGWVPSQEQVKDFLGRHPGFQSKFPDIAADALQGLISATQWEAWLGLYFDKTASGELRRVLSYEVAEPLPVESRQQIHSQRLKACEQFPKKLAAGEQFFDEIVLSLIALKILAEADFTPRISSRALTRHTAEQFFGRKEVLSYLDEKFADGTNVLSIIAWGGVGKTSLLVHWVETRFVDHDWKQPSGLPLVDAFLEWSFYALGTGALDDGSKVRSGGVGTFFQRAFEFFGDPDYVSADKGTRLAKHIQARKTLLILDGLEPLQHPPGHIQAGQILDPDLRDLIEQLAAYNPGLCLITSREHLKDLEGRNGPKTTSRELEDLDETAAVELLRNMQLKGSDDELARAAQEYKHHALSLTLIGRFLCDAHEGDIRKRDLIGDIEEADDLTRPERHRTVWRIMASYHAWLGLAGPAEKSRCLNILRLTGLFDSAISADCQEFLRQTPIVGITDAIQGMKIPVWNQELKRLERNKLLKLLPEREGGSKIEVHPLIRAYFAKQLKRDQPEAFREAHSQLFDYLCENTPHRPDGIDGLAPLYEAVTHGCLAGRQQEACEKVYRDRILRGTGSDGFYSQNKLGAIGANLAAVAAFFDEPWSQVSPNLTAGDQAWLLNEAAFNLRALGRLTEALQPMCAVLARDVQEKAWKEAAISASNLSELELTLGRLRDAVTDARLSITYADLRGEEGGRIVSRTTAADALHQTGQRAEAGDLFAEGERMQQAMQPEFDLLYSMRGFQYCDWLLAPAEQAAWRALIASGEPHGASRGCTTPPSRQEEPAASALPLTVPVALTDGQDVRLPERLDQALSNPQSEISDGLADVERRGATTLAWVTPQDWLLDIALDHLTLARVGLFRAILANPLPQPTLDLPHVVAAVNGLRAAGSMNHLPRGLLTAALYHFVRGEYALAEKDLAEAQQIAERGPMPLFLADVHLTRARLWGRWKGEGGSLKIDARAELVRAGELIRKLGYGRRYEELADAESAFESGTA